MAQTHRQPTRPPTLEDVAREAGVSRALVSLALRGSTRVSARSRDRIQDAASRLGYRPNLNARNLAARLSGFLGVLVSDLHNPFFAEVVDGLSAEAAVHALQVILATGQAHQAGERTALETLLSLRPAGIVLTGPVLDRATIERAATAVPLVVVNRLLRSDRLDSVTIDEYAGSALAVSHLVDLGHRRIAHIDGGAGAGAASRRTGYLRAMQRHGLDEHADVLRGGFTEAAGWQATDRLLRATGRLSLPSALYVANDYSAVGVLARLAEARLEVPGELSVIGFDDAHVAGMLHTQLTTIHQPKQEMGRIAVAALRSRQAGRTAPQRHVVPPSLVVRSTTAPRR
jgi:DNA-binding LacI/PurR family transcriptional regulator